MRCFPVSLFSGKVWGGGGGGGGGVGGVKNTLKIQ